MVTRRKLISQLGKRKRGKGRKPTTKLQYNRLFRGNNNRALFCNKEIKKVRLIRGEGSLSPSLESFLVSLTPKPSNKIQTFPPINRITLEKNRYRKQTTRQPKTRREEKSGKVFQTL